MDKKTGAQNNKLAFLQSLFILFVLMMATGILTAYELLQTQP